MPSFLVHFAQFHEEFRLPELESLAVLENIPLKYEENAYSHDSPFMLIELPTCMDAIKLIKRAILVKDIVELWAEAPSLTMLHDQIKASPKMHEEIYQNCSFKFKVESYLCTMSLSDQLQRINSFSFLNFKGPIDLKNPDVIFAYYEDYSGTKTSNEKPEHPPRKCYFGVWLAKGNREIVDQYDLKKRQYLGTTSMDAELSLIMANMALAQRGSLVLDPFVGTGSFLISSSHFGAFSMGSDIDGRQIRGGGKGNRKGNIVSNISQYGLESRVFGTLVCDIAHHPWRDGEWFDAIICDPPYGVRAGAKMIASSNEEKSPFKKNGELRYPTMKVYEMSNVIVDLIAFAAKFLNPGGRLVFWLPTIVDEYEAKDIPTHKLMRLIANSEQNFGKWSRRLVTMEKLKDTKGLTDAKVETAGNKPGHSNFREKYFEKVR